MIQSEDLPIGTKILIGKIYAENSSYIEGEIIRLVEGTFEVDNGLYTTEEYAPAVFNKKLNEFDSIYHLFGNDLELFSDCKIVSIVDEFGDVWCCCEKPKLIARTGGSPMCTVCLSYHYK